MTRTALLAICAGVLSAGCVVTTGGTPSRSPTYHPHHQHHGSPGASGRNTPPPSAPATQQGGGQATAAPPVATPIPGNATTGTPAPVIRPDAMRAEPGRVGPNYAQPAGSAAAPLTWGRRPVSVPPKSEEEKQEKNKTPPPYIVPR
ncbi:MAG: hypothetical protein MUF54_24150 [Polyangiaceae bacterium]|jgi:hypothetical protein|nr:hypothetical protein [Polyangiaceae bacterium]